MTDSDADNDTLKTFSSNKDNNHTTSNNNTSSASNNDDRDADYLPPQTLGEIDCYSRRPRFPSQYNKDFDTLGRRRQVEYVIDPDTGERRRMTVLEQTGRRKPYKRDRKLEQAIAWRRAKLSQYMVMGKSLPEISRIMDIPLNTLYRDHTYLKKQAAEEIKNHIEDLPLQIKQSVEGLNRLTAMLYDLQDLESIKAQNRRTSDHVRVLAMNLIKDCIKEKNAILTSTEAISHALNFVDKTKQEIKEKLGKDIESVIKHDKEDSEAINDAIANNPELKAYLESSSTPSNPNNPNSEPELNDDDQDQERQANKKMGMYDVVGDTEFGNNGEEEETEMTEEAAEESKLSSTNE